MPGGIQPKLAAKIADKVLGSPSSEKEMKQRPQHPMSTNSNLADIKADDQGVGDFVRGGVNGF